MNERAAQLVEGNAGKPWDLGSNPRSPHILVYFSLQYVQVLHKPRRPLYVHNPSVPLVPQYPSSGQDPRSMECLSQRIHTLP